MEKSLKAVQVEPNAKACANCQFVHHDGKTNEYVCWKNPPASLGAIVQTPSGSQVVQFSARAPVGAEDWCGEFKRKLAS